MPRTEIASLPAQEPPASPPDSPPSEPEEQKNNRVRYFYPNSDLFQDILENPALYMPRADF